MQDYDVLFHEQLKAIQEKCYKVKNNLIEIKLGFIKSHPAGKTILFHFIKDVGFNADTVQNILAIKESGKQFFSDTHRILVDRRSIFIIEKNIEKENYLLFDKIPKQIIFNNYTIQCSIVPIQEINIHTSTRFAYLDYDKLEFPLHVRYAQDSDYFYPFGMFKPKSDSKVGKKKLSKYFKDEKLSLIEKENTPVLFSSDKLIWVVNHRIDNRYKITSKTQRVLKLVVTDTERK